ncbi:MAG: DNA mismatch repair protein MutS [Lachnospiraceae bacterium]|nr:DNA mismatch repair protein MutS [Lachnospiraceae bacterium]
MDEDLSKFSPLMQQYFAIKNEYKDCILFYRLGDFYEMFYDDAVLVSKELELTLTGKNVGQPERAPMCGIPFHSYENYLTRLIDKGYKVAICEQVEDPKTAKGLVKREVIRIVTPGTNLVTSSLDESRNNYLMAIAMMDDCFGLSVIDITTGDFLVTEIDSERKLLDEISKFEPSEIICNEAFGISGILSDEMKEKMHITLSSLEKKYCNDETCKKVLLDHFNIHSLEGLGLSDYSVGIIACGMTIMYLLDTQKCELSNIIGITPYTSGKYMILDSSTRRNLELTETLREKQKRGSLLWILDKTKTAMGARLLRSYIEQPLLDETLINDRLDAIDSFSSDIITREEIREYLNPVYDLERLIGKVSFKSAGPRDLLAFHQSLSMLPFIKNLLSEFNCRLLKDLYNNLDPLTDLYDLIDASINEDAPLTVREGDIIKNGYNEEVDRLRKAKTEGKTWVAEILEKERERTGIKNLKVSFNKVFGYYLEVTNSFKNMVPAEWIRKQTLTGSERYITPELKELEDTILNAEEKLVALEYNLFVEIREKIASQMTRIMATAKAVAAVDVFTDLSLVAEKNDYVRPNINNAGVIVIKDGRHPVVEKMIPDSTFVANDTYLDNETKRVSIITGPNMAGKSTYMRQSALIVLMAQIGCYVPAREANIGICDRIFTRVGASDDLASGQSTFMVEMSEVSNILRNATKDSLLILDEIGRGTSTYDGLSIAWAVVEYIADKSVLGAKALFATHYHELTELEGKLSGVNNYCIAVKEQGDDIIFLRKIISGGADKSYGIQVARLAGVPETVLERAKVIADKLDLNDVRNSDRTNVISFLEENADLTKSVFKVSKKRPDENQLSLFGSSLNEDVIIELRDMNLSEISPIDALNKLYQMQKTIKSRT